MKLTKSEVCMEVLLLMLLIYESIDDVRNHSIQVLWPMAFLTGAITRQCICRDLSWQMFCGGIAFGLAVLLLSLLYREMIGTGDGLVLCVCGAYLGFAQVVMLFARAIFLAALWGIVQIGKQYVKEKRPSKAEMPFIPFLLVSYGSILLEAGRFVL